jgi:hypothetical protein
MHVHTSYMHTCIHTYMHARMHAYICTYLHTCTPAYIRTLVHMCVPTYMPTYTYSIGAYTFTHACTHVVHCLALARAALMYRSAPLPPPNRGVSTRSLVSPPAASLRQLQLRTHALPRIWCLYGGWHEVALGSVGTRLRLGVLARGCAWGCWRACPPSLLSGVAGTCVR